MLDHPKNNLSFLFFLFIASGAVSFAVNAVWGLWKAYPALYLLPISLFGIVLILHAYNNLGIKRSLIFLLISSSTALIAEHLAIIYQPLGTYEFKLESSWSIGYLPLGVLLAWCFFIYIGYSVSNAALAIWHKEKPRQGEHAVWLPGLLALSDALLITSVDLMIDPVQQFEKNWIWVDGGAFFGVPPGNFLGWIAVVGSASFCFRMLEYLKPNKDHSIGKDHWIPTLSYLLIASFYLYAAHKYFGWELAGIGLLTMLPVPVWILLKQVDGRW